MSLVCYDSSDDSDREEAPRPEPNRDRKPELLRPKKRGEPVRISVPHIQHESSDEDEDEPVRKKKLTRGGGLSSLLPQPKNLVLKETQRPLVPHTLTKRPTPASSSAAQLRSARLGQQTVSSASPSAIKAAAKSAALQLAKQITADEEASDEDLSPENYFSLSDNSAQPEYTPSTHTHSHTHTSMEDAPLNFTSTPQTTTPGWAQHDYQTPSQESEEPAPKPCPQDYYSEGYYQDDSAGFVDQEEPESSTLFNDEAFRRLQGKQNRGKEEIKFLEIKGDDQLSGNQQWMTKNMSTETEPRKSFSKKKGDQPTGQQRRKHQITYLIHQAKERELELKNNWADNKITRRQTQAKYGF